MDNMTRMKTLLEAVDAPKVDAPFKSFKNTPNEQVTDFKTMNDGGNDLNRKKNAQFRSNPGDNPMAMTAVKVKDVTEALQKKFNKFKLNESTEYEGNLHADISRYLEASAGLIEDIDDQVWLISKWMRENLYASPVRYAIKPTRMGTYMYIIEFTDIDGHHRWLAFDDESDIAEISDSKPNPRDWS